jgi:hypothetical protein
MSVPLVVALWENQGFSGRKRLFVEDARDLNFFGFTDKTSAIGVHPGPDYVAWKAAHPGKEPTVGFYEHPNYGGAVLILTTGAYANIHNLYNFGDIISSVRFNPTPPTAGTIAPIPVIVELYKDANFIGQRIVIVENSVNLVGDFGSDWNDVTTSVKVKPGPNFVAGNQAKLYRDFNYVGGEIDLPPGNYPNIGASHGFNDVVSSIKVR